MTLTATEMKNQKEKYSEPSLVNDTRRQHMRGKMVKRSILAAEQEKPYMELNFQNAFCYVNGMTGATTASVKHLPAYVFLLMRLRAGVCNTIF